jgi:tetratricopeptide (TPR) repeat protein
LVGLGGVGKTQIALECAFQLQKILPMLSVFWVRANDMTSFDNAFREIGQQLEVPGLENDKTDVKRLVKTKLSQESTGRWLMIMDNADDFEIFYHDGRKDNRFSALSEYLPFSMLGAILFTTRDREAATRYAGSNVIDIDKMDDEESRELLQRSLQDKQLINDHSSTTRLLELLVNLPLAVMQAAAYLNVKGSTIAEYLRVYKESSDNTIKLLSKEFEDIRRYPGMKNPVATTWLISFQQIQDRDPLAADYMAFMSCIKEQDIPLDLLPPASAFDKTEALGTLKAFGFIKTRVSGASYDMHRLVHTAMQNWLKLKDEWKIWNHKTLKQITNIFPWPQHKNTALWMMYLPHAQCTVTTFNTGFSSTQETKELLGRLLHNLGECSRIRGQYAEAETTGRQTLQLKEIVLGKENPDTLLSMNNLASSLRQQGKYAEAEAMHRQTLQLREMVLGKEHPDTLGSMNNLASSLRQQGKYAEAEAMHRR